MPWCIKFSLPINIFEGYSVCGVAHVAVLLPPFGSWNLPGIKKLYLTRERKSRRRKANIYVNFYTPL